MKIITWDTNFNGKLSCQRFVHIDLPPARMPTIEDLQKTTITIQVADHSHQPVQAEIEAIIPFRLAEISNIHTWPSHGMNTADFIHWLHQKKQAGKDTQLAVYYYRKTLINN